MHSFKDSKLMPYKSELLKEIILDIEKYPEFLPWCKSAEIITQNDNFIQAKLAIEYKKFSETYISKITTQQIKDEFIIKVVAISGPFKILKNEWSVKQINNHSKVNFSIDFKFKSMILDALIGMFFSVAKDKIIAAFESRAKILSK